MQLLLSRSTKTLPRPPKWPLLTPYGLKIEDFEIGAEIKVKPSSDGESNGDTPEARKPYLNGNPQKAFSLTPYTLI